MMELIELKEWNNPVRSHTLKINWKRYLLSCFSCQLSPLDNNCAVSNDVER
jgi:hypothetical protein